MKINPPPLSKKTFQPPKPPKKWWGVNPKIFKAYDIRGIYPEQINGDIAYLVGRAFVKFLKKEKTNIVVGRDARLSTPELFKGLVKGITDQGANVIDIGFSITPMVYFATAHFKLDGGIQVTASHNPSQYNGFKMVRENAVPIGGHSGIKEIQEMVIKGNFETKKKGEAQKKEILSDYAKFNLKDFDLGKIKNFKIVVDTANAVPGIVAPEFFKKIDCKTYYLYSKLDGNFPNHSPDPIIKENLKGLQKEILNRGADLGIAFDGDGDRIIFVDEKGKIISGDLISAFIVTKLLKEKPGEKILCDIRSSALVQMAIKEAGGRVVIGRVGHSFIKERMRKENILFQGELNGHYYLRDHYFSEVPFFIIFKVLQELAESKKSLSELVEPFIKYFYSGEMNFEVEGKEGILKLLEKKYNKGKVLKIDGLRVDFKDWWFNARPSNTEPVLRLVVEANTEKLMEEKKQELVRLITKKR